MSEDKYKAGVWLKNNKDVTVFFADHEDLKAAQAKFDGKAKLCREGVGFILPREKGGERQKRIYELVIDDIEQEGIELLKELHESSVNILTSETMRTINNEARKAAGF